MWIWRLTKEQYRDTAFSGEGARRTGGRWNSRGVAMVYCAQSCALAILEQLVHVDPDLWPDNLVSIAAEIEDADIETLPATALPATWRDAPSPPALARLGDAWITSGQSLALRVPSAVVPNEHNILLNPMHPGITRLRILGHAPCVLDPRLRR